MNQKKLLQIAIIIVLGVWTACLSYLISSKIAENRQPTTTQMQTTTTAPTTELSTESTVLMATTIAASSSQQATTIAIGGNNVTTTVGQVEAPEWEQIQQSQQAQEQSQSSFQALKDSIPSTTQEIIDAYVKGVNNLKNAKNFTMLKEDTLNITPDKVPGGSAGNGIFKMFLNANKKEPITYSFQNGMDSATGKTPMQAIAPLNQTASLSSDDIKDARSAIVDNEGSYSVKISLKDEHQIYPNDAPAHSKLVEVVDVSLLLTQSSGILKGAQLNSLDILYSGTTVEATFDKDGRIVKMTHYLPVSDANGNISFLGMDNELQLHGDFTSIYTFTY